MATDKSQWNTKINVSQATIDKIKSLGMSGALKSVGSSQSAAYVEGVKRLYGANRVAAASKSSGTTQYRAGERNSPAPKTASSSKTSSKPSVSPAFAPSAGVKANMKKAGLSMPTPAKPTPAKPKAKSATLPTQKSNPGIKKQLQAAGLREPGAAKAKPKSTASKKSFNLPPLKGTGIKFN